MADLINHIDEWETEGHKFGNFQNYYSFNKVDARLGFMTEDVCKLIRGDQERIFFLDVGCNEGDLTLALQQKLRKTGASVNACGVDLDPVLIGRANSKTSSESAEFYAVDLSDRGVLDATKEVVQDKAVGSTETTQCKDCTESICPKHRSSDFILGRLRVLSHEDRSVFDLVTAFSITMWIHINHGDDGLRYFLRKLSSMCMKLIIEPQPWKCYRNAARRMRRLKLPPPPFLDNLEWQRDIVERMHEYIMSPACGFTRYKELGETQWGRPVILYWRA
eukprot:Colp12_sorted_trinity150504_noHs@11840